MNFRIFYVFSAIVIVFLLSGCFSSWKGDEARIIINLSGGSAAGRAVNYPPDSSTLAKLEHVIAFSSSSESFSFKAAGVKTIQAVAASGSWNILVKSYLDGSIYARGEIDAELYPGQNNYVHILMHEVSSANIGIEFNGIENEIIDLTANITNDIYWFDTLNVTINGSYDSYSWYLNEGFLSQFNGNSVSLDIEPGYNYEGFTVGKHRLLAIVTKGGIPYSKELIFNVKFKENP